MALNEEELEAVHARGLAFAKHITELLGPELDREKLTRGEIELAFCHIFAEMLSHTASEVRRAEEMTDLGGMILSLAKIYASKPIK